MREMMVLGQWKTVVPERQGTNKISPIIAPAFCLERFPGHNKAKQNPGRSYWTPWIQEMSWESGETTAAKGHSTKCQRREGAQRENPRDLQKITFKYSIEHLSVQECRKKKKTQGWRKNYLNRWERVVPGTCSGLRIVSVPTNPTRKPHNS